MFTIAQETIAAICNGLVVIWKVVVTGFILFVLNDLTVARIRDRRRRKAAARERHPSNVWHIAAHAADQELRRIGAHR